MSVLGNPLLITPEGYQISRSVRLRRSASAYFNRTPASAGNRKTWTWSGWVKFGDVSTTGRCLFGTLVTSSYTTFGINVSGQGTATIGMESVSGTTTILSRAYTNAVIRDPSAWYHIIFAVDTTNATASDRLKIYFNGVRMSVTEPYVAALNTDHFVNQASVNHALMAGYTTSYATDGYLTEVNFIDGQSLGESSFGEFDSITGVWKPKKYGGSYGTNGFYLNFSDPSAATATAIGKDYSGNGNNWTPNNISVTAGVTYDSMLDVPTMWIDGGTNRGNYCVMNPLKIYSTTIPLSNGNLQASDSSASWSCASATMRTPTSGKWYWEVTATAITSTQGFICAASEVAADGSVPNHNSGYYRSSGSIANLVGTVQTAGASYTSGDVIGVAVDVDAGTVQFYKNNVAQGANPSFSFTAGSVIVPSLIGENLAGTKTFNCNFGQRPFAYTPPTGFKALNTQNLPDPTIKKPNQYMDATTWAGNGSTQTITNSGSMQPDLVWIKRRNAAASHMLYDSLRTLGSPLSSDTTAADPSSTLGMLTSFNSNGFGVAVGAGTNNSTNGSGDTFVGWQWKKGATQGFDIVTYTGVGGSASFNHSLGVKPAFMIVKGRSNAGNSADVYHKDLGATKGIYLDLTNAAATNSVFWNNTEPTSTQFTVGATNNANGTGFTYVAWLWAEVAGFSKFGSYTGNGSADGPFVYCGFRPRFIMWKRTDSATSWGILDTSRDTYNVSGLGLYPNLSNAETDDRPEFDILSNGFKWRSTYPSGNASGGTYIFAAFAENPFKNSLAR